MLDELLDELLDAPPPPPDVVVLVDVVSPDELVSVVVDEVPEVDDVPALGSPLQAAVASSATIESAAEGERTFPGNMGASLLRTARPPDA